MAVKTVVIPFVAKQGYSLYQKYVGADDPPPARDHSQSVYSFQPDGPPFGFYPSQHTHNGSATTAEGPQNDASQPVVNGPRSWEPDRPPVGYPGTQPTSAVRFTVSKVPLGLGSNSVGPSSLPFKLAVVHPKYVSQVPLKLKVTEKALSFSGDDFVIQDLNSGQVWFRVNGKPFSIKSRKHLLDGAGGLVAELNEKVVSFRGKMTVNDAAGRPLFHIIPQLQLVGKEMHAQVHNLATGSTARLVVKGNWVGRHCSVFLDDPKEGRVKVASLTKQFTAKSLFLDSQDYVLKVSAGVDVAVCVLMAIAYDERYND